MQTDHFTYRVSWSAEDKEHVGLCLEFPSLSWLAATPEAALKGIGQVVAEVLDDLSASGEPYMARRPMNEADSWRDPECDVREVRARMGQAPAHGAG